MYIPDHFNEPDPAELAAIIHAAPLACIIASTDHGLIANHIPLIRNSDGSLTGHIAINNEMHRLIQPQQEVLVIFNRANAYVSPNDYPSKSIHHQHVPTWNYQVAHIYGTIDFLQDEKSKRAAVGLLTHRLEHQVNGTGAWRMADAPKDYLSAMLDKIIAFKISVTRTSVKSKLSQNRDADDFDGAVHGLRTRGAVEIADLMQTRASKTAAR